MTLEERLSELEAAVKFLPVPATVLRVEPGDIVVFTTPLHVSGETAERLKAYAERLLPPGAKAFVCGDGLTVASVLHVEPTP